jgi:hypothetical protein
VPLSDCTLRGPWSRAQIESFLEDTDIPVRLGVVSPSGWPTVLSLWFLTQDGEIVCATQQGASVIRALEANDRCAFEIAGDTPPYFGVRGRGRARLDLTGSSSVLHALIDRYLGSKDSSLARWLLSRVETEVCIRIDPVNVTSWDYRERMTTDSGGAS